MDEVLLGANGEILQGVLRWGGMAVILVLGILIGGALRSTLAKLPAIGFIYRDEDPPRYR